MFAPWLEHEDENLGLPGGQLVHFTLVSGRNTEARVGESDEQASDTASRTFLMMRRREPWCEQCRTYQSQSLMLIVSSVCSRSDNSAQVCLAHSASLSRPHHSSQSSNCRKPKATIFLTLPRWREPPPSPPRGLPPTMQTAQATWSLR